MMKTLIKKMMFVCLFYALVTFLSIASASSEPLGLGKVAENLMEPVGLLSDFVHTACFGIGIAFVFTSLIKYIEHRRSPMMVPIGTVVFLLIAGVLLILMPFLGMFTEGGIKYSLMQ